MESLKNWINNYKMLLNCKGWFTRKYGIFSSVLWKWVVTDIYEVWIWEKNNILLG